MSEELPDYSETEATVQNLPSGYSVITFGSWQVTVGPDGMILLPKLVRPVDVTDLVGALLAAKEVSEGRTAAEKKTQEDEVRMAHKARRRKSSGLKGQRAAEAELPALPE